jgi:hypothetical protein
MDGEGAARLLWRAHLRARGQTARTVLPHQLDRLRRYLVQCIQQNIVYIKFTYNTILHILLHIEKYELYISLCCADASPGTTSASTYNV